MLFFESSPENQFPPFEAGFSPWDNHEPPFLFQDEEPVVFSPQPSQEPVTSNSNRNNSKTLTSGSDETSPLGSIIDERKRRRMISNRASARRSRMRKQRHLENLRNQLNRLRIGNRELMNRFLLAVNQNRLIRSENEHLLSEAVMLRRKLWDIRQVLLVRRLQQHSNPSAWPCNNFTSINGQLPHLSLIM